MKIIPFDLPPSSSVLIAGAGGGYDFLCGLPIALELESRGHKTHIASYSFTNLKLIKSGKWHGEHLIEIKANSTLTEGSYFPEVHLARWYKDRGEDKSIWCLSKMGVKPTLESYNHLIKTLGIDVVICVDGGVDGIFRGDEYDMGTPSMDSISVIATSLCNARDKIYTCTAFGAEGAEGSVSHAQVLNRIANLIRKNAMLGVGMLLKNMPEVSAFLDAVHYIFRPSAPLQRSTIISSILASIEGAYGYTSVNEKTMERPPWLSPLTLIMWYFQAEAVARMKYFYEDAKNSETVEEVAKAIEQVRRKLELEKRENIPI